MEGNGRDGTARDGTARDGTGRDGKGPVRQGKARWRGDDYMINTHMDSSSSSMGIRRGVAPPAPNHRHWPRASAAQMQT